MSDSTPTLLAIFAHPDDELGCAGTLANHSTAGHAVHLLFLSQGENASSIEGSNEDRIRERKIHTEKIGKLLNVTIHFLDLPDSRIAYTVENAYKVAEKIREIQPDGIITWNVNLRVGAGHPDHKNTSRLVLDAINYARYRTPDSSFHAFRKPLSLYQYFDPSVDKDAQIVYVDVSEQYEKIMEFIKIYQQAYGKWPVVQYKARSLESNGWQHGVKYAEVFQLVLSAHRPDKLLKLGNIENRIQTPVDENNAD